MQQSIAKGDILQRIAGLAFIAGAVVTTLFNALYPRVSDQSLDSAQPLLDKINDAGLSMWKIDNFFLAVGIWLLMMGWVGIYRSVSTERAAPWARLGLYGLIVGTTLWTMTFAAQTGMGLIAERWAAAGEPAKATWLVAATAVGQLSFELFAITVVVYWLALTFLGIGMALSEVYPKWAGWALIVLGAATAAVTGVPQFFAGPSDAITNLAFAVLAGLSTLWALVVGVWIARRAW